MPSENPDAIEIIAANVVEIPVVGGLQSPDFLSTFGHAPSWLPDCVHQNLGAQSLGARRYTRRAA